jgi:hypothetical protein
MNWNQNEEDFLKKMSYQCMVYYDYFNKKSDKYYSLLKKFSIPILIISSINSLMAVTLSQYMPQHIVSILNAILSAFTGILGSIQLFLKINEKLSQSILSASSFQQLSLKISKELALEQNKRSTDGVIFLNDCFNEFHAIIDKSPQIDRHVLNLIIGEEFQNNIKIKKNKSLFIFNETNSENSLPTPKNIKQNDFIIDDNNLSIEV